MSSFVASKNSGFTLIELVIVMVIVGILAAIITPRFVDLRASAINAAKMGFEGAVKSAWAIAIADKRELPTVTELADHVNGGVAVAGGVQVKSTGETTSTYTVATYTGTACHTDADGACEGTGCGVTTAVTDIVNCVGKLA